MLKTAARTLDSAGERLVATFSRRNHAGYHHLGDFAIALFGVLAVWGFVAFLLGRVQDATLRFLTWLGLPPFLVAPFDSLATVLDSALFLAFLFSIASIAFLAYRRAPSGPAAADPPHRDDPGEMERRILVRVRQRGGDLSVRALATELDVHEDAVRDAVERLASRGIIAMD